MQACSSASIGIPVSVDVLCEDSSQDSWRESQWLAIAAAETGSELGRIDQVKFQSNSSLATAIGHQNQ
jgi:hypothetical protein